MRQAHQPTRGHALRPFCRPGRDVDSDWTKDAWETAQGWTIPDEAVLDEILTRFTGIKLSPSPITDGAGEMVDATEPGFLEIYNIYFH
jgi:hypothetical protein